MITLTKVDPPISLGKLLLDALCHIARRTTATLKEAHAIAHKPLGQQHGNTQRFITAEQQTTFIKYVVLIVRG
jgi:hypothetical protein